MAQNEIQAKYEELNDIANQLETLSETVDLAQSNLKQRFAPLEEGGWQGRAANDFFAEMVEDIFPSVDDLSRVLLAGKTAVVKTVEQLQAAEEDAARQISFEGDAGGGSGSGGGGTNGYPPPPDLTNDDQAWAEYLDAAQARSEEVYSDEYMDDFVGRAEQGADNAELNTLMEKLMTGHADMSESERNKILDRLADIRGEPREKFRSQYETFKHLLNRSDKAYEPLNLDGSHSHPDFLGSTASLRYGRVTGDVLGVDPVFGALLNPTGGLVGAGNVGYHPGDNSVMGYHGIFHDGGGYLFKAYERLGPGYEYLGGEGLLTTSHHLAGQISGIAYWMEKPGLNAELTLSQIASMTQITGVQDVVDGMNNTIDRVQSGLDSVIDGAQSISGRFIDGIQSQAGSISSGLGSLVDAAQEHILPDFTAGTIDTIQDVAGSAGDMISDGIDRIQDTVSSGVDHIQSGIQSGIEQTQGAINDPGNSILDTLAADIRDFEVEVVQTVDDIQAGVDQTQADLNSRFDGLRSDIGRDIANSNQTIDKIQDIVPQPDFVRDGIDQAQILADNSVSVVSEKLDQGQVAVNIAIDSVQNKIGPGDGILSRLFPDRFGTD